MKNYFKTMALALTGLVLSMNLASASTQNATTQTDDKPIVCMPTTNVSAAFSSGKPTEKRLPMFAFDGSGLTDNQDGTFSHEAAADNKAWATANGTGKDPHDAQWIAVQFKSPVNINKLHVWNLNWSSSYLNRGVKDIEVYVSSNTATDLYATAYSDAKWTKVTTATLAQASGEATYTGEDVVFDSIRTNVSWVLFRCTSNHGANASYYGLSEVQFYVEQKDEPQPQEKKYYVTGNAALVGEDNAWNAQAIEMIDGSYTFTALAEGDYQLKVTDGTWDNSWGYDNLSPTVATEGLSTDKDGNICFTVYNPNDVTVSYKEGYVTITGNFKQQSQPEKNYVRMLTTNVKSAKGSTEGGAAINAFNGSGLDAYGLKHDNTSATAWRTSNGTGTAPQDYKYVAVQFNEPIDLAKLHIWNFNWLNGSTNLSTRGYKEIEIWVSSSTSDDVLASKCEDGSTIWTKAISTTLTQASANNDYTGEDVVLEQTMKDVRWVIFLCVSNYGGGAGYCGLSEVQFYEEGNEPLKYVQDTVNYVAGNFTNWADGKVALPTTINFPKDSTLEFKQIQVISKKTLDNFLVAEPKTLWFGAQGEGAYMTRDNSTWKLDGEKNVFAYTDFEGDYTFSLNENDEFVLTWPEITDCKPAYELVVNNEHHLLALNEAQTEYKEYMIDSVQLTAGDLIALYDTCGATTFKPTVTGYTGFEPTEGDSLKVTEDAYYAFYFKPQFGADELYVVKYAEPSPIKLMPTTNVAGAWSSGASPANRAPLYAFDGSGLTDNGDGTYKHGTASNNVAWTTSNTTDQSKQDSKQWIAVKFNEPINLAKMNIWNLNWNGYTIRGIKDVEVYVSTSTADDLYNTKYNDPSGVWTLASTLDLPQAPATTDYLGEEYILTQTQPNVTWVMFRILTNYNETAATGAHYCGLSEVQFFNDTEFVAKDRKQFTFIAGDVAKDNPAMFAATWSKDGTTETLKMNSQKNGEETWYQTSILTTIDSVVLLRCATGATEVGENIWNQTANYELCDTMYFDGWDNNLFKITCEKPLPNQFYIKNNWSNSEDWTWVEMTAGQQKQDWEYTGVIGSLGINISSSKKDKESAYYSVEDQTLVPVQGSLEIGTLDTVTFFYDAIENQTVLYNVIGKYVTPPATKYYITGNAALVGEDNAWNAQAIEMTDSTYTFTSLPAGDYEMKVTNGAWEPDGQSWGYTALSDNCSEGVEDKEGNIHFIVETANDVTVSIANGDVTVIGTFKTIQPGIVVNVTVPKGTPACYFYGDMSANSFVQMTKVDDTHYTKEFPEATSIGWGYLFVWDPNDWDTKNIEGDFTTEPVNGVIDVTVSAWTKNPPATDLDKVNAQTGQRYNILGQKVNASYHGFVIMDGQTYLAR